jgi:hypothetical protein
MDCVSLSRPWTWRDKIRARLFPYKHCDIPDAPKQFGMGDCINHTVRADLSFVDRLRVLITGKIEVESKIVTEHVVGALVTNSVVRSGRFWK